MFYYLILNSSILKKKKEKDKIVLTLIGGSLIYLVLHAFLSLSVKKDIVKYIWFLFLIDISAVFISSDFHGFSSLQVSNNNNIQNTLLEPNIEETRRNTKLNSISSSQINLEEDENKNNTPKSKSTSKKHTKKILKNTKSIEDTLSKNKISKRTDKQKKVKFEDSTPITELNNSQEDTYNLEEAQNINLTLESLENLNLELNYPDENSNDSFKNKDAYQITKNAKKNMEDEYSDIGSELDLEKFESTVANM